jgi:hypothetical protein
VRLASTGSAATVDPIDARRRFHIERVPRRAPTRPSAASRAAAERVTAARAAGSVVIASASRPAARTARERAVARSASSRWAGTISSMPTRSLALKAIWVSAGRGTATSRRAPAR